MAAPGLREDAPLVSIQRVDLHDHVERHLAWGVLISSDVVMVDLADWPADGRLEVLLASEGPDGRHVERIGISRVEIVAVEDSPEGAVAAVKLAHESRQQPFAREFDLRALQRELRGDPDIRNALERLGYVPPWGRDIDTASVLGRVAEWEEQLRNDLVRDQRALSVDTGGLRICCFWRCNRCQEPF